MISQIYTGTNALKSSFTRKGKMSLAGALSDAYKIRCKMYINNLLGQENNQYLIDSWSKLADRVPVCVAVPKRNLSNQI